jgi:iron complex outermembrane receptor protein
LIGVLATAAPSPAARAQSEAAATADTGGIEEIVVTSRRVEEKLQTTGVSIEAFTQSKLDELGVKTLTDLSNFTPNVQIEAKSGNASQGLSIKIRGIGVSDVDYLYSDPSVALYIDGVFQSRAAGTQFDLFDLERVEILRGPQGTLYGKNSLGGAVNIITRKPDGAESADVTMTVGNYGELDFLGHFNTTLVDDKLFASVAVDSVQHDGYYKNVYLSGLDPENGDRQGVRGAFRWLPTDGLTVDFVSDYSRQNQHAPGFRMETIAPKGLAATALTAAGFSPTAYAVGNSPSPGALATASLDYGNGAGLYLPQGAGDRGRSADDADFTDQALTIAWDLSPTMSLRSTTGYREFNRFLAQDIDGTPAPIANQVKGDHGQSLTSELQFNAKFFDERLNLVAGLFGLHENLYEDQSNDLLTGLAATITSLRAISTRAIRAYDNRDLAGYSHLIFNVTDNFRLNAGIRYSWERKEDNEVDSLLVSNAVTDAVQATKKWESTTPQFGAEYTINDNMFSYATIAKGYASGGFSSALAAIGGIQEYNPESLWSYEAGFKSEFFEHTLRFNAAAFYMDYSNIVVQSFSETANGTPVNIYANAGKATVKGLEVDLEWRPIKSLTVTAGLGLLDQKFLQFGIGANGRQIPAASAHFLDSPDTTLSATIQYTVPMDEKLGALTVEGGWSYRSRSYLDNVNVTTSYQDPYSLFDGHLTYQLPGGHISATLYAENITNQVYVVRGLNLMSSLGYTLGVFGPPQTYGLRLKYKF